MVFSASVHWANVYLTRIGMEMVVLACFSYPARKSCHIRNLNVERLRVDVMFSLLGVAMIKTQTEGKCFSRGKSVVFSPTL